MCSVKCTLWAIKRTKKKASQRWLRILLEDIFPGKGKRKYTKNCNEVEIFEDYLLPSYEEMDVTEPSVNSNFLWILL